jgi:bifunctional non-homologous end joining protein LigD
MVIKQCDLFYKNDAENSDKEYHLQLVEDGGTYKVNFQYGKRGSTLTPGNKITTDDSSKAEKVYNKKYVEELGKGYVEKTGKASSVNYSTPSKAPAANEVLVIPQLCNPVDSDDEVEELLQDDRYGMQEKKDGKHMMLRTCSGKVRATNKKGKECGYPEAFAKAVGKIDNSLFDGEAIGEVYHIFDLLECEGVDLRGLGYGDRFNRLNKLISRLGKAARIVPVAAGTKAKQDLYDFLEAEGKEGVVFKLLAGKFKVGRPASGGDFRKKKFLSEVSCRVKAGRDGKRSIGLELLDAKGNWVDVGFCTIPPNKEIPIVGQIIEVSYLNVQGVGGHLYQPVYKELRDDIDPEECLMTQIKYKVAEED